MVPALPEHQSLAKREPPPAGQVALVDHLRALGGGALAVVPAQYVFDGQCEAYQRLLAAINER